MRYHYVVTVLGYVRPTARRTKFENLTTPVSPAASLMASVMAAQVSSCTSCGCGAIIPLIGGAISLIYMNSSCGGSSSPTTWRRP
jgi:hypothetical protein